jgi:aspartate/methionine/tyrosine aminotransferase
LSSPIVLIDGLTKNFRLPGWRCCWVCGPAQLITALGQSGSYLDGGCSHPTQLAAIPLLEPQRVQQDKEALQQLFLKKRNHVLDRLDKMGLTVRRPVPQKWVYCPILRDREPAYMHSQVEVPPVATFYIWLDVSGLPAPLNSGLTFFEELLKEKTIVVPGVGLPL